MNLQEIVNKYISEGKTKREAINLAYSSMPRMQQGGNKRVDRLGIDNTVNQNTIKGQNELLNKIREDERIKNLTQYNKDKENQQKEFEKTNYKRGVPLNPNSQDYRKAYDDYNVFNYDPKSNSYIGRELNEIVIPARKGFWEQSRDRYLEEHKNDGILGAIGSVATYPLGVPKQAMMYKATGKVQEPSEAMGIGDTGILAFGTDALLDPANLIGAGVLTKEKLLANVRTSIAPELRQGLRTAGVSFEPKFKSEINWGNWNKEIPENSQLIKEYNTIEQTSKANGSWMKNPNGSAFQGTPVQFIQQNSENFKKAFPKGGGISYRGDLSKISEIKSQQELGKEAIKRKYNLNDDDTEALEKLWERSKDKLNSGKYTTNDYEAALSYAKGDKDRVSSLYTDIRNPKFTETGESFRVLEKDREILLSQGYDALITKPSSFYPEGENVLLKNNQIKSATGNNGMFDMTNPNIYKSVLPIAGASYIATQGQEELPIKQQGGTQYTENELAFIKELNQSTKKFQEGGRVYEQYEKITGKPWATAKQEGLTDGSYEQNIRLLDTLKQDQPSSSFTQVFNENREKLGAGKVFEFKGKMYTTDSKDDVIQTKPTNELRNSFGNNSVNSPLSFYPIPPIKKQVTTTIVKNTKNSVNSISNTNSNLFGEYASPFNFIPTVAPNPNNFRKPPQKTIVKMPKKEDKGVFDYISEFYDEGVNKIEDLATTAKNGINRYIDKNIMASGEDKLIKEQTIPLNAKDYYNKESNQQVLDAENNRTYKQQSLPISSANWGYRNRGEYKDLNTKGLEVTAFNPFDSKNNHKGTSVIALDTISGKIELAKYDDIKDTKNKVFSKTYMNKVTGFAYDKDNNLELRSGSVSGNSSYKQPVINVIGDDGKSKKGSLNVLVKGKQQEDMYGSLQGGRVMMKNPDSGEVTLVSGSVNHIASEFKRLKENSKYLELYTLDNGTYARGLSKKDDKLSAKDLRSYDNENTSGGNGLYIKNYNSQPNKFNQEIVTNMPNVRDSKDESFKSGHALKNEQLNIVLHHTAYTNEKTNSDEVRKQYMKKGNNSSHVIIEEDGSRTIYASPEQVTFHAGESKYKGRDNVNDFGIGVEFQGDTNKKPLTNAQIDSFIEYYKTINTKHHIPTASVITHQMIAPGRKPDITNTEYKRVLEKLKKAGFK